MKKNEPLYGLAKTATVKMFQAVHAKRKHQKCVKYFNDVANYNKRMNEEIKNIIMFNKTLIIAKFWEGIENT